MRSRGCAAHRRIGNARIQQPEAGRSFTRVDEEVGWQRITAFSESLAERYRLLAVAVNVITPKDLCGPSRETANVLAPRLGLRPRPTVFSPSSAFQRSGENEMPERQGLLIDGSAPQRVPNQQRFPRFHRLASNNDRIFRIKRIAPETFSNRSFQRT